MKTKRIVLPSGIVYNGNPSEGEWEDKVAGTYEPESLKFLENNVHKVDLYIDVGSFYGYLGLHACKKGTRTIFIEPNESCCTAIQISLNQNKYDARIINAAASNEYGTHEFAIGRIIGFYRGKKRGSEESQTIRVGDLIDSTCMLKVDVEGMEKEVLEGITPNQDKVKFCMVEFHPMHVNKEEIKKTLELIESFNWRRVGGSGDPYKDNANLLFVNND